MNVARILYPVEVLGPGKRVGIWTCGCRGSCPGCASPELKTYDPSRILSAQDILALIKSIPQKPDGVSISGGEPFYDPPALLALLVALEGYISDILVFSGFTEAEILAMDDPRASECLEHISVLVDGEYIDELNDGLGLRGSSNQKIIRYRHNKNYVGAETWPRSLQTVAYSDRILTLGMPDRENDQHS